MTATPNPTILFGRATHAQQATTILAVTEPQAPAAEPAGVIKAKHVKKGQVLRAWLKGQARGGEYTVQAATRSEDGSTVHIAWEQPCQRPDEDYKAAYRFFVVKDVKPVKPSKPQGKRPTPPEHLTHQPFAALKELI